VNKLINEQLKMFKMNPKITTITLTVLPILISLFALLYSSGIITKFKLKINIDGYLLPHSSLQKETIVSFPIVIPILFTNTGNNSGVVEDVILEVKNISTNKTQIYSPISEIDLQKYINGKHVIHGENIISPNFHPFNLRGNESHIKSFLFMQENGIKGFPGYPTKKGNYLIKVFVKANGKNYQNKFEFTLNLNEKTLNEYNNGASIFNGRINFPYNDFKLPKQE
jgi:hypothetical protein